MLRSQHCVNAILEGAESQRFPSVVKAVHLFLVVPGLKSKYV